MLIEDKPTIHTCQYCCMPVTQPDDFGQELGGIEMSEIEAIRLKKKPDRGDFEEGIRLIEAQWPDPAVKDD